VANQRMSQYTSRGRFEDQTEGPMRQAYGRAQEVIGEHPGYSALACFGIGLCVGTTLTLLLASGKKEKAWYEGYLPDEGHRSDLARNVREMAARVVPDAVARYLKRR
jgi:hypothetical protein